MADKVTLRSPVGRIVAGSLYKANDKDFDGKPLVVKTGPNTGQPRVSYYIALAIKKEMGHTHWAHTEWGGKIWDVGCRAFPQASQRPDFAWKIEDGDSTIPNKKGKKPCDQEGWPGHWIIRLSSGFAPKVYRPEGAGFVQVMEADYIKAGYYVEVLFNVDGNGNQNNSGVYLNTQMVCFRGFGPEITFGPSVEDAGFGQSALPAGASAVPVASTTPMPAAASAPNGIGVPVAALPGATAIAPPAPPVVPNVGFLNPTVAGAAGSPLPSATVAPAAMPSPAPAAQVAPPAPAAIPPAPTSSPSKVMTAKAAGASYEAYLAAGWSDAQMVAQGLLQA